MRVVNEREIITDQVNDLFASRWSPRSFSEELIPQDRFDALIEAARWAPSSRNLQPWRILYARRGSEHWDAFLALLNESNQEWAEHASHLVLFLAQTAVDGRPNGSAVFDTGAAWMSFALQAQMNGLVSHPMGGFKKDEALSTLNVPDGYVPLVMVAAGFIGDPDSLPEHRRSAERTRSDRKPLDGIASEGSFPNRWT